MGRGSAGIGTFLCVQVVRTYVLHYGALQLCVLWNHVHVVHVVQ